MGLLGREWRRQQAGGFMSLSEYVFRPLGGAFTPWCGAPTGQLYCPKLCHHVCDFLLPSCTFKNRRNYIGPTQIVQDNFLLSRPP